MKGYMEASIGVSVKALRILTYTILIKAVISAVMFICTIAALLSLKTFSSDIQIAEIVYIMAEAARFVNIVAFMMCLGGIATLSEKFVSTRRIMVAALLTRCMTMMLATIKMSFDVVYSETIAAAAEKLMLIMFGAEKLLIGSAFLCLMKGFGEVLMEEGAHIRAMTAERLGAVYYCCNIIGCVLMALSLLKTVTVFLTVAAVVYLAGAVLEFVMYRQVSEAAFLIWRKRTFDISLQRS